VIIVAGSIVVEAAQREAYLEGCAEVMALARAAPGCLDFALSADLLEPGRINVYERWESRPDLERFRGSGPDGEQRAAILEAAVDDYDARSRSRSASRAGTADRLQVARQLYGAFASGDRSVAERHLADDLTFSAPPDVGIDRATYFERCWPNADTISAFEFKRLVEVEDEVHVTYEATRTDGRRFRNTEILGFDGDRIARVEVYFGWDLD
jgi:quinol monooxygenase YgiN